MNIKLLYTFLDSILNFFVNIKLAIQKYFIKARLKGISIEYQNIIDSDVLGLIEKYNTNHISEKGVEYFTWLKHYHWVMEAPLFELTNAGKYEFSTYDHHFNIYYIKVIQDFKCIGFIALQRRNYVAKVLYAYYDQNFAKKIADIIILQCITQDLREIICYDNKICRAFQTSGAFLYRRKKVKQSIISKVYNQSYENYEMNFGDGDCSLA